MSSYHEHRSGKLLKVNNIKIIFLFYRYHSIKIRQILFFTP